MNARLVPLILFFALVVISASYPIACPPSEDIYPCSCERRFFEYGISCFNLTDVDRFSDIIKISRGYNIAVLELKSMKMKYIPKWLFYHTSFKALAIENSDFDDLFEEIPYDPTPKIVEVYLNQVHVKGDWEWRPFMSLKNLETLTMHFTDLNGQLNTAHLPESLKFIYMAGCDVRKVQDNAFQRFPELKELIILWDSINTLKRNMFPRPSKLRILSFSFNQISSLPEDLFENMENLEVIDFMHNYLTTLSANTFAPLLKRGTNLDQVNLFGNALNCDCNMKWVLKARTRKISVSAVCDHPVSMKGKEMKSFIEEDFAQCK